LLCSIAISLEDSLRIDIRIGAALLAVLKAGLIVRGMTLSAILMFGAGAWMFAAWTVQQRSRRFKTAFVAATTLAGVTGLSVIVKYWDYVYLQGSLHVRIPQYTRALHIGIEHFPLGRGIDGYGPSVHNFLFDYFVEIGIIGAGAFFALISIWIRNVWLRALRYPSRLNPFEFAFIVIFGAYVIVIFFQPVPVRRFWWVIFAASWAVIQDRIATADTAG
jgi:hypothetical protein